MLEALMRAVAALPLPVLHAAGAALGWLVYAASPTYRRHLRENLETAGFRDASIRRAAIAAAGKAMLELPAIWFRPRERTMRWLRRLEGEELIDASRMAGKGIVFLTPHQDRADHIGHRLQQVNLTGKEGVSVAHAVKSDKPALHGCPRSKNDHNRPCKADSPKKPSSSPRAWGPA